MHRSLAYWLVASFLVMVSIPESVSAQQGGHKLKLGVGAVLDFGGGAEYDDYASIYGYYPNRRGYYDGRGYYNDDLRVTPGFRGHLDYDIGRYVSLGGFLRFSWWRGEDAFYRGRNLLVDFGGRATGHYDWRDFRFYGALMIGPTISRVSNDNGGPIDNPAVGVNAGITPGVEYWLDSRMGLFVEMFGWNGHFFGHDYKYAPGNVDIRLNQVLWQFGFIFAP